MKKLCAIGEALIDFIPEKKGLRLKDVTHFKRVAGGAPANVASANAKLNGKSKMITKLGDDAFGHYIMDVFQKAHLDTQHIVMSKEYSTALAFVSLGEDGNRDFMFYRKNCADLQLTCDEISENVLEDCGVVHFCSVDLVESPMKLAHQKLLQMALEKKIIISFDPNVRINLWDNPENCKKAIHEFLPYAEIIKISDEELTFISGKENIEDALDFFFKDRCKLLVYTMGKDGAKIYTKDGKVIESKGILVNVKDTTGAGDSFIGAFLHQLLKNDVCDLENIEKKTLQTYLEFANLYAAYTTTRKGAIEAMATIEELEVFKKSLKNRLIS